MPWRSCLLGVLCPALGAGVPGSAAPVRELSAASRVPSSGRIVFETSRTTQVAGLVAMDADGSHRKRLAGPSNAGVVVGPAGRFAYTRSAAGGAARVVVVDAKGGRVLGPGRPVGFSPDGRTLVVSTTRSSWELRDCGTGALRATFPPTLQFLGWSPTGLLWSSGEGAVVTQPDGSGEHIVAQAVSLGPQQPRWSPDGSWIAYATKPDGLPQLLRLVRPDGTDDHALGSLAGYFTWSPDGRSIAFVTPQGLAFAAPDGTVHPTGAPAAEGFPFGQLGFWSPDGARFAFLLGRKQALAVVAPATDATHVVATPASPTSAAWSPDGRKLLLVMGDNAGVAVVPASATNAKPKVLARAAVGAAWLPDGRVLVNTDDAEVEQLGSVAPSRGRVRLLHGTEHQLDPAWSPDHTELAFALHSDTTGFWTISVADADGSHRRVVAHSDALDPSPSWSPNGRLLAYAAADAIYIIPVRGGAPRRVTRADNPWTVAWSPDGKRIAFGDTRNAGDDDRANIVLVDPNGRDRRVVVHGAAGLNWGGAAWSPDGRTLAVARRSDAGGDPDGVPDLYLIDLHRHRETEIGLELRDPSFSPDGKQLAAAADDGTIELIDLTGHNGPRMLGSGDNPSWSRG